MGFPPYSFSEHTFPHPRDLVFIRFLLRSIPSCGRSSVRCGTLFFVVSIFPFLFFFPPPSRFSHVQLNSANEFCTFERLTFDGES